MEQFEVIDTAAIELAPRCSGAGCGRPVDVAVVEVREAIYAVSPLEPATPVLHLRADDRRLLDVNASAGAPRWGHGAAWLSTSSPHGSPKAAEPL
jgi:hypothetical protein